MNHLPLSLPTLLLAAALACHPAAAQSRADSWTVTWGAAPAGPPSSASLQTFSGQTVRLALQASAGGNRVRIRLSNEMGSTPLLVGAAHIGLRAQGSDVAPGTGRALRFGGRPGVTIPPGAPALSDPVELNLPPLADVVVSLYLPGTVKATTVSGAAQGGYVSAPGDYTASASLPVQRTIAQSPFLSALEVDGAGPALVVLGDAIGDGNRAAGNVNRGWTDWLARRLHAERGPAGRLGVVNRGIAGNRLLGHNPAAALLGRSAQERFERDVLASSGVRFLVLSIGASDIGHGGTPLPALDEMVAGYRQLIARARAQRLVVIGATLLPFEGAQSRSVAHASEREALRQTVNAWIRTGGEFDAVLDFDRILRDPARPGRLLPAYDSGDHLHPNELGQQALADAVPLALFAR